MPLNLTCLATLQENRGVKSSAVHTLSHDKEWVVNDCRHFIREHSNKLRNLDSETKRKAIETLVREYVGKITFTIDGYSDANGRNDIVKIIAMLMEEITDYSILTEAMRDEKVYEIRINGKEIKIEKEGRVQDLTAIGPDGKRHIVSFTSLAQQETIFRKILGDVRLNPKYAVVNASTDEGYRVAAVHHSALSPDPMDPTGEVYNAMVLRKFKKSKMNLNDIVKTQALSDNMARFSSIQASGGLTFFTVGPTSSGKTTLNNAILQAVPGYTRTVLLQNPSEIDLRFREEGTGRITNDVLHLEARDIEDPSPTDPTMPNLMAHILRLSPTFVCFGELRTNKEFKLGMQIAQAGHPMNCTYHSEDAPGAITRYLTAYLAESGNEPSHLALQSLVSVLNMIFVQTILPDGTRKVIQITEVVGIDPKNPNQPLLNDIYRFEITGEPIYEEDGTVKKIQGKHMQVGYLTERTIKKLKFKGVSKSCYEFLIRPEGLTDEQYLKIQKNGLEIEETYIGENKLTIAS